MKHTVTLKNGITVPAIGLGTWYLGDDLRTRKSEIEALQAGINAGMTLIDTAEMYGNGRSESLVGEAIKDFDRKNLFLVSKVLPNHANKRQLRPALENTLHRMGVSDLDLYLYHWRGSTPLSETVAELERAKKEGLIKEWGVSNLDIDDMEELYELQNGDHCLVNQVLYHTGSRGIEYSLLPWMEDRKIALMAYCPLAQAGSLRRGLWSDPALVSLSDKYGVPVSEIMLAWSIRNGQTIAIPRSGKKEHVLSNVHADELELTADDLRLIDSRFPRPIRKMYLDMQ